MNHPGPPSCHCNYWAPELRGGCYWLMSALLIADEPEWCGRTCRHCGEVRRVEWDAVGDVEVSTVLIDSYHVMPSLRDHPAYETLVRGWGKYGEWGTYSETRPEALSLHWDVVERLRTGQHPDANILFAAEGYDE